MEEKLDRIEAFLTGRFGPLLTPEQIEKNRQKAAEVLKKLQERREAEYEELVKKRIAAGVGDMGEALTEADLRDWETSWGR